MSSISAPPANELILLREEPREYVYQGKAHISLTRAMKDAGFGPNYASVPRQQLAFASRRGRIVHKATEYLDRGILNWKTVDKRISGYVNAYHLFLAECKPMVIAVEKRLVSQRYGIGTTPDRVMFIGGERAMVEIKTTQTLHASARIQTKGQQRIWNENYPNQWIYRRYGLKLNPDGTYRLIEHHDADDSIACNIVFGIETPADVYARLLIKYGDTDFIPPKKRRIP